MTFHKIKHTDGYINTTIIYLLPPSENVYSLCIYFLHIAG